MAGSMNVNDSNIESVIVRLHSVNAVKFGDFKLKSGIQSPVYFDLRVMISYPEIMVDIASLLWNKVSSCKFKTICGVPYTALPLATLMSTSNNIPMLIRRKEVKGYGTNKLIEGVYENGDSCLIVEDVVSSGSSIIETAQALQSCGIVVKEAVVLLNREQGGHDKLANEGITLYSIFTMSDVLRVLNKAGKMSSEMVEKVTAYIAENKFHTNGQAKLPQQVLGYGERAKMCNNPVSRKLFEIMEEKKSNLALSADLSDSKQLLQLIEKVGPYVCIVKTHIDILDDFDQEFTVKLKQLAAKFNFLIFEDRKFADIGNTVKHQFKGGVYHISDWANIVNAHAVPGAGVVHGLKEVDASKGCLLIAEMSSAGNLATGSYTEAAVKMAEDNKDFVIGFISVSKLSTDPTLIHMTPGVQLESGQDNLGQNYLTPTEVITNRCSDIIIVGRGIYQAADPAEAARQYQVAGYDAFVTRATEAMIS
ncbi:uncharacterized protein LOC131929318 [Physella acuta]|uniref:uncharacterized protein LOC131929318 n=1 Tax=Physella acuta TaxID=109671 RepID=UPI0027DAF256|nr:uncharacterized protein LOC131929318 [Physella acuta]